MSDQRSSVEREPAGTRAGKGRVGKRPEGGQHDWGDEAAQARTTDDPRRQAPHDRAGIPSSAPSSGAIPEE